MEGVASSDTVSRLPYVSALMEATKRSMHTLFFERVGEVNAWRRGGSEGGLFVAEIWDVLCARLSVTEESVRQGWAERGECSATACPGRRLQKTKKKKCVGCMQLVYCSRSCQRA